jgi:hypothetical protein
MGFKRVDPGSDSCGSSMEVRRTTYCLCFAADHHEHHSRRVDIAKVFVGLLLALGFAMKTTMDIIAVLMFSIMVATTCPDLRIESVIPFLRVEQL